MGTFTETLDKGFRRSFGQESPHFPAPPSKKGTARASSIGYGCMRHVQYGASNEGRAPMDISGHWRTRLGQHLEGYSLLWLNEQEGVEAAKWDAFIASDQAQRWNLGVPDESLPWTASPDFGVWWEEMPWIVENKWQGYIRFAEFATVEDIFTVHSQYAWQVQAQLWKYPNMHAAAFIAWPFDYGAAMTKMRGKEEPTPWYIEEVQRSEVMRDQLVTIGELVQANTTPEGEITALLPRGFDPGDDIHGKSKHWQCNYCPFKIPCILAGR